MLSAVEAAAVEEAVLSAVEAAESEDPPHPASRVAVMAAAIPSASVFFIVFLFLKTNCLTFLDAFLAAVFHKVVRELSSLRYPLAATRIALRGLCALASCFYLSSADF